MSHPYPHIIDRRLDRERGVQETSFAPDKEHRIREDVERGHRQIETSPPVRVYSPRCQNISSSSPPTLHAESSTTPQGRYLQRDGGWHHSGRSDPGVISLHHSPEDRLPETQFLTGPSAVILPDNQDILPPSSFTQLSSFPGRPTLYNKCPNREYYPSRYHQSQFDALALQDYSVIEDRERVGLNSLDGDIDQPPLFAMPLLIECAILGSPQQKLTLSELRITLKRRFRHFEKEEERGVRSWERTLLQNLSKKDRFLNAERSEPGQGGYWSINPTAPPPTRTRKRTIRPRPHPGSEGQQINEQILSPIASTSSGFRAPSSPLAEAPLSPNPLTMVGGPNSLFPVRPTERTCEGKLLGRYTHTIKLPFVIPKRPEEVCRSSPRHWNFSSMNSTQRRGGRGFEDRPSLFWRSEGPTIAPYHFTTT